MSVPTKIERKASLIVDAIKTSKLDVDLKDDLIESVEATKAATNGYTPEEKLQAVSENQFHMTFLMIRSLLDRKPASRLDVIVLCKWQIVIICFFITVLLAFRPQLAQIIEKLIH